MYRVNRIYVFSDNFPENRCCDRVRKCGRVACNYKESPHRGAECDQFRRPLLDLQATISSSIPHNYRYILVSVHDVALFMTPVRT